VGEGSSPSILLKMKILGLSSCLHKNSSTGRLLRVAQSIESKDFVVKIAEISHLPLFNTDIQCDEVEKFRNEVAHSDGILFCSSEFHLGVGYSISSPLQNAFDWALWGGNVFDGKPAAFLGLHTATFYSYNISEGVSLTGSPSINCYHLRQLAIIGGLQGASGGGYTITNEYLNQAIEQLNESDAVCMRIR
jgi:hypothetical protein